MARWSRNSGVGKRLTDPQLPFTKVVACAQVQVGNLDDAIRVIAVVNKSPLNFDDADVVRSRRAAGEGSRLSPPNDTAIGVDSAVPALHSRSGRWSGESPGITRARVT
jgi:hypothetical protein